MYHIAIVEDEAAFSEQLCVLLRQYQSEYDVHFKLSVFQSGEEILKNYQPVYDLILLDIEMPGINGMETAEQIRQTDTNVVLVFITNMASYAIHGYEVGALDFVMKPINYYTLSMRLTRALKRLRQMEKQLILLNLADGVKKLGVQQIYYVEVQNRILHYHTSEGIYSVRGTMQSAEKLLDPQVFVKCNHWYMVNLRHVSEVRQNKVVVGGYELEISRRNRTPFMKALSEYVGGMR